VAAPSAETLSGSISGSQVPSNGVGGVSISGSRFLFPDITFALQTPSGSALTGAGGVMAAWMTISSEPVNGLPLVTLVPE
jgi:hypothetical protein